MASPPPEGGGLRGMGVVGANPSGGRVGTAKANAGMVSASVCETTPPKSCKSAEGRVKAGRGQECEAPGG
eukprot:9693222-Prorocentrum_lima.AAC.1